MNGIPIVLLTSPSHPLRSNMNRFFFIILTMGSTLSTFAGLARAVAPAEVVASITIPEPAAIFLVGSGIVGLAALGGGEEALDAVVKV